MLNWTLFYFVFSDERDSQIAILLKALQNVRLEAETHNNERILQVNSARFSRYLYFLF